MRLHTITVHVTGQQPRRETLEGRAYLVGRVVPIVEGVLKGYWVPAEEIAAFVEAWDDIPLPVSHPQNDYGDYVSAKAPALIEQSAGRFFHARMDGKRLTGEVWLDVAKCTAMGGDAAECLRRLEAGEPLEVSTAFFSKIEPQPGIYNGVQYAGIHRHIRPNHLALLPNGVGACDWQMGCGVRTHAAHTCTCQKGSPTMDPDRPGRFRTAINAILAYASGQEAAGELAAHLTHDDLRLSLGAALRKKQETEHAGQPYYGDCYVVDIEDGAVIYQEDGHFYRQAYTATDDGAVSLTGEAEAVQRNTRYVPVALAAQPPGGQPSQSPEGGTMRPKAELISALIAHAMTTWADTDKAVLEVCEDTFLTRMLADADARTPAPATQTTQPVTQQAQQAAVPATLDAIRSLLTTELDARDQRLETRLTALSQQAAEQTERTSLTTHLQANGFTEPECAGMSVETLRKLVQTVAPATYAALGMPVFPSAQRDDELPDESPNWQ